jgi:hypothetical protein
MKKKDDSENLLPENFDQLSAMDRRSFLEYSLKLTVLLASSKITDPISAYAQTPASNLNLPKRYLYFQIMDGACQSSNYLSPLANKSNDDLVGLGAGSAQGHNRWKVPGIATAFRPSSPDQAIIENVDFIPDAQTQETGSTGTYPNSNFFQNPLFHARTSVGGYQMPLLWSSKMAEGTTGTCRMQNLIEENCALIYGLENSAAHSLAQPYLNNPEPGSFSIGGYIHYHSIAPALFPAISNSSANIPFSTPNGAVPRLFASPTSSFSNDSYSTNAARMVLNPLIPNQSAINEDIGSANDENVNEMRRAWLQSIGPKMEEALDSIKGTNEALMPGTSILYDLLKEAKQKVETKEYESVIGKYISAFNKYKFILQRAARMARTEMQGFTDPLTRNSGAQVTRSSFLSFDGAAGSANGNINTIFGPPMDLFTEGDFSYSNGPLGVKYELAHLFAFAEVAFDLEKPLTNVLHIGIPTGLVSVKTSSGSANGVPNTADAHKHGVVPNLAWNSFFYYIFNTLLMELTQTLKGRGSTTPPDGEVQADAKSEKMIDSSLSSPKDPSTLISSIAGLIKPILSELGLDSSSGGTLSGPTSPNDRYIKDPGSATEPMGNTEPVLINAWRDTLIAVATEFCRDPRRDGSGSDHLYKGASVALFGGRLGSLKIYGKTTYTKAEGIHSGSSGLRSNQMMGRNERFLHVSDVGASIASLFAPEGARHPKLQTLIHRSNILFKLDDSGNIVFTEPLSNGNPFDFSFEED